MREIDWRLSLFQVACFLSVVVVIVSLVLLYHHQTEDYYIPIFQYLASIKIAVPPLLVLISSYALTFLVGEKVADAPKLAVRYVRDTFLQKKMQMAIFIFVSFLMSATSWGVILNSAPPYYVILVAKLLGGEQDRQQIISKEIDFIADKNLDFANELRRVVEVFSLRSKFNFASGEFNTTEPRILVRALEVNISDGWKDHPLRYLALAEAYSIWSQAERASSYSSESRGWQESFSKSIKANAEVVGSKSPLATQLMKASALNNSGNAYLYAGDMEGAERYYKKTLALGWNASTAGNFVAALVYEGKYDQAVSLGEEYMKIGVDVGVALTQGSSYSAIVVNTAFAYLMKGEFERGARLMLEAYDLESDDLNALNFAVALFLSGKNFLALDVMRRHFKYPDISLVDQKERVSEKYNNCYYLVFAVLHGDAGVSLKAANLYAYLRIPKTKNQLELETSSTLKGVLELVDAAVAKEGGACGDLLKIPRFSELLHAEERADSLSNSSVDLQGGFRVGK